MRVVVLPSRLPTQSATGTVRSRHTRSTCKDRSSGASISRFAVAVSRFGFAVGTRAMGAELFPHSPRSRPPAVVEFHCSRSHFRLDNAGSRAPEPPGEVPLDFVGDSPNHSNGGLPRWEVDRRGRVAVDFQGDTEVDLCFMYVTESPSVSME